MSFIRKESNRNKIHIQYIQVSDGSMKLYNVLKGNDQENLTLLSRFKSIINYNVFLSIKLQTDPGNDVFLSP